MWSQCCHIVMSQIHEMTTSPWGYSVVTDWCSPCEVIMMSFWYRNYNHYMCDLFVMSMWYEFTTSPWGHSVVTVWCHRYMRWLHHHEVTVSSQCDVTDILDDQIIMRSQCCHRTMLTMWDHYNGLMISKLWHHKFEMFVRSQWYKLSTSAWGHSVVTV